jgi:hypothetical protein
VRQEQLRRSFSKNERQFYRKFKHASDFGIDGTASRRNVVRFKRAVRYMVTSPDSSTILGSYRGKPCFLTYHAGDRLVVIYGTDGMFWSAWKMTAEQLANVEARGSL